jgi:membrane protein DedA with SNARE-associated domain
MFDWLVATFTNYPYLGVAAVFLICGLGFPLPEELVLVIGGYVCFKGLASLPLMMISCAAAILAGDLIPFLLGRVFGSRLLRIRPLRMLVTKRRLSMFDRWFRRRGDLVIFFARFLTGLRIAAYFTAGTMKMPYRRFMALDLIGISLLVPLLIWIGFSSGHIIDQAIAKVQHIEQGILYVVVGLAVLSAAWYWLSRRRRHLGAGPRETFVGPSAGSGESDDEGSGDREGGADDEGGSDDAAADEAGALGDANRRDQ